MSLQTLPQQLEIVLWTRSVQLMKTSPTAARALIGGHDIYAWLATRKIFPTILGLALGGFGVGFLLGMLYLALSMR